MKKIYLNSKRMMLLLASLLMLSYVHGQITVSGTVYDDSEIGGGFPLPGANIIIKGTTIGTTTDLDGKFTIEVPDSKAVLKISSVGLAEQEIPVGEKTTFEVRMKEDAVAIDEVVAVGYGTQREEDLSIAATVLGADEFKDKPVLGVSQALQGKASGVQVTANSGSPGAKMSVRIRGTGTVGTSDPLYVVDGIPVGTECNVNPADIESMSILKDASATAIYGSRGANGVVIITTKGGGKASADGKAHSQIEFDAYKGIQSPRKKLDLTNAQEFIKITNEIAGDNALPYNWADYSGAPTEGITSLSDYTDADRTNYMNQYNASVAAIGDGTDWQDEVFRNASISKYQVRYSVASQKMTYSVSGAYQGQEGIVKTTGYERYNVGMKSSHKVFDNVLLGHNMNISKSTRDQVDESSMWSSMVALATFGDPTITPTDDEGNYNEPGNNSANPLAVLEYQGRDASDQGNTKFGTKTEFNAGINLWGEIEIISGLTLRSQYGYSYWDKEINHYMPEFDYGTLFKNETGVIVLEGEEGHNTNTNTTLTYDKKIYSADSTEINHAFTLLGGFEYFDQFQNYVMLKKTNVSADEDMRWIQAGDLTDVTMINDQGWQIPTPEGLRSFMGRASYSFKNKYLVTATVRRDESSKFGPDKKKGIFPSFSLAWKLHQEDFFKSIKALKDVNECKIRFGWGKVGNQFIDNFGYVALLESGYSYVFGPSGSTKTNGQVLRSLPNSLLAWESQNQTNVGIDLALMKNKILFTGDFFRKRTDGMLVKVPQPAIAGTPETTYSNAAEVMNTGVELSTSYRKLEGKFHYSAGLTYTQVKNIVTDLGGEEDRPIQGGKVVQPFNDAYTNSTEVGNPIASFKGYKVAGIFKDWEEVNRSAQAGASPGDLIFEDVNKDGKIDESDQIIIGNPHPDFIFGINLSADYKGFDISMSIQGQYGNEILNAGRALLMTDLQQRNYHTDKYESLLAWHPAEGEPAGSSEYFRIDPSSSNKNVSSVSSYWVEDGSYARIKDITIGYNFPKSVTNKLKLKGLRLYAQTQNLYTLTKYKGYDPEIGTNEGTNWDGPEFGIDRMNYPVAQSFLLGVNLKL